MTYKLEVKQLNVIASLDDNDVIDTTENYTVEVNNNVSYSYAENNVNEEIQTFDVELYAFAKGYTGSRGVDGILGGPGYTGSIGYTGSQGAGFTNKAIVS